MELRIWSLCGLFVTLAIVSHCSVNAHTMSRRSAYDDGDDDFLGDEGTDDEAQKDEGNEPAVVGTFVTEGREYNAEPGQSVTLECKVNPPNVPVVSWYKVTKDEEVFLFMNQMRARGSLNPLYDRMDVLHSNGEHDLTIQNVMPSDAASYKCTIVPTDDSEMISIVHTLKIMSKPNIISLQATNGGTVVEGSELKLTCEVQATPSATIVWSRTTWALNVNERLNAKDANFTLNSVTIQDVKPEHAGSYYCYAFNDRGTAQREINITVLEKPHAHVRKTLINTGIGDHALFECSTRGTPAPEITWFKDNVPVLVDNKRFFITKQGSHSNLTVIPASVNDYGTYTCVVQNYHGLHNRSAELVQRPVIDDVEVESAKLAFKVHSHLPLEQIEIQLMETNSGQMLKFDVPQPTVHAKTYDFTYEVKDVPSGKYHAFVRAKNEKDWSSTDPIEIEIQAEPINIQQSSIYRPNSAHSTRHSAALLSSVFMYLLIRML